MTGEAGQGSGSAERMGGYEQFCSLLFYVLQSIYASCFNLCSHSFIISVLFCYMLTCLMFVHASSMLNLFSFTCLVCFHAYAYMIYMLHKFYVLLIHIVMDIFEIMVSMVYYPLYVIIIMLNYGIKMIWKMPIYLTIQKPNFRHFSVRGFAAVLKPDPFDGKNFLIWKAKMELWLTAMSCFHVAEGKPDNLTPENEAKF